MSLNNLTDEELIKLSRRTLKLDNYNISSFFRQMELSFNSKRSLLLGIFKNDNINELLGVIIIDNLDPNTESMDIDLYLRKKYRNKNQCQNKTQIRKQTFSFFEIHKTLLLI